MPSKWRICKEGHGSNKESQRRGLLVFSELPASLRPLADQAVSILSWVLSRGRSYGFLWADSFIQKNVRKDNPTPAFSPVSDRRRLTALVEVHWARRVQAPMPQISNPGSTRTPAKSISFLKFSVFFIINEMYAGMSPSAALVSEYQNT
jgi:hypothetical protein